MSHLFLEKWESRWQESSHSKEKREEGGEDDNGDGKRRALKT